MFLSYEDDVPYRSPCIIKYRMPSRWTWQEHGNLSLRYMSSRTISELLEKLEASDIKLIILGRNLSTHHTVAIVGDNIHAAALDDYSEVLYIDNQIVLTYGRKLPRPVSEHAWIGIRHENTMPLVDYLVDMYMTVRCRRAMSIDIIELHRYVNSLFPTYISLYDTLRNYEHTCRNMFKIVGNILELSEEYLAQRLVEYLKKHVVNISYRIENGKILISMVTGNRKWHMLMREIEHRLPDRYRLRIVEYRPLGYRNVKVSFRIGQE